MTDKELIIKWINNLTLYEKDYDTLNMLLNTNGDFFVRVMTELAKGNLLLEDFETVLGGYSFDDRIKQSFMTRDKMEQSIALILQANESLSGTAGDVMGDVYRNLIVSGDREDLIEEFMEEDVHNFFKYTPESSILYRKHKKKMLDNYNNGLTTRFFLSQYVGIPVIPINYNDIILTEDDIQFGLAKGISINEVKKIKSLSLYYRGKEV